MTKQERKKHIVGKLHDLGVFYTGEKYIDIERLELSELESLHFKKHCEHVNVILIQKDQPAGNKLALA